MTTMLARVLAVSPSPTPGAGGDGAPLHPVWYVLLAGLALTVGYAVLRGRNQRDGQ